MRDLAEYDSGTGDTVIVNHISYDAYGGSRAETNAAVDHLFGYTGREWDAEADLQYNRARWYDPAVGRWLSEDPIGFQAGDVNLNRFVTNSPTTHFDPDGLRQRTGAWGPEYPRNRSESAAYAQWFEMNLPDMNNDFVINTWDVLDYLANGGAGLGDGVTFGYLNDAREYLGINNGIDQTSAIYTAGLYTGVAVGMGISGGAGGGAAATGWAVRTGRVYVMAGNADDVATTAQNILDGNVSVLDLANVVPRNLGGVATDHMLRARARGAEFGGGMHRYTRAPEIESHHMPAHSSTQLEYLVGPAIQMDPRHHRFTSSHSQMAGSRAWREEARNLIDQGRGREAMAREIRDVRRVALEYAGDRRLYNNAMREMLEYARESTTLIPTPVRPI